MKLGELEGWRVGVEVVVVGERKRSRGACYIFFDQTFMHTTRRRG